MGITKCAHDNDLKVRATQRLFTHRHSQLAIPFIDPAGNVEGWFQFTDEYLCPEVRYTSFPPTTTVKLGGRALEIDRAVPLKLRLLEEHEDYHFWCNKKQHSQRINCGEYHKDFGDVEVGYSFSSPQTHIWFAGYAIHADCFENLFFSSHNATVRVTPEHVIAKEMQAEDLLVGTGELKNKVALNDLKITRSLFEMVVEEGADFPIYTAAVPKRVETYKGYVTELVPTAEFVNDCEREIIRRDAWDVGAAVAQVSDPVSFPPTFPPVKPFEHSALFWSFIFNKLREQRLSRDDLEQAFKDVVLLNRYQQYERESRRKDRKYQEALDRLAALFSSPEAEHKGTWPVAPVKYKECDCVLCREGGVDAPTASRHRAKLKKGGTTPHSHSQTYCQHHHHQRQNRGTPSTVAPSPTIERRRRTCRHRQGDGGDWTPNNGDGLVRRRSSVKSARFWDRAEVAAAAGRLAEVCLAKPNDIAADQASSTPGTSEPPPTVGAPLYFYSGGVRSTSGRLQPLSNVEYPLSVSYGAY